MPTHSKAIREIETLQALSEALGFLAVTLYVGILAGAIAQIGILTGVLG